ncbi:hypothetical protein CCUS01_14205 [Colletotrichum cuscutae]|uniref:Uncharacterized protein n=1 Tax=Colletotrichum cuscutae TaxID=1209917 RepID=A0AAJ0DLW3_9PEZI|nr:hypothetical protein CCUS01_14205 [Colletotrichum cuscutae]
MPLSQKKTRENFIALRFNACNLMLRSFRAIYTDSHDHLPQRSRKIQKSPLSKPLQDPHRLLIINLPLGTLARKTTRVRPDASPLKPVNQPLNILLPHPAANNNLQALRLLFLAGHHLHHALRRRLPHNNLQQRPVLRRIPRPAGREHPLKPATHQIPHPPRNRLRLPIANNLVKSPVKRTRQPAGGLNQPPIPLNVNHNRTITTPAPLQHPKHKPVPPLPPQHAPKRLHIPHHDLKLLIIIHKVNFISRTLPPRPNHDPHGYHEPIVHALEVRERGRRAADGVAPARVELDALRADGLGVQRRGRGEDWYLETREFLR